MLLDVFTAATRELRVGQSTLRRWIREGRLPVVRLGRRVLIRPETLEELIKGAERRAAREGHVNPAVVDILKRDPADDRPFSIDPGSADRNA